VPLFLRRVDRISKAAGWQGAAVNCSASPFSFRDLRLSSMASALRVLIVGGVAGGVSACQRT